jgi:hypothetical protein
VGQRPATERPKKTAQRKPPPRVEAFFPTDLSRPTQDILQQDRERWSVESPIRDSYGVEGLGQEPCRKVAGMLGANTLRLVMAAARTLWGDEQAEQRHGIGLLFLPPYSLNLNLIERLWKFVKKRCLYGKYYADSAAFQQAIWDCIAQAYTKDKAALESLLSLQFQTFKAVPMVGDQSPVVLFPVAKRKRSTTQKVSTKAA